MKLEALRTIALSLPEVTEEPHFHLTSFRVRGKILATAAHSGEFAHVFIADEDLERALAVHPAFLEKLFWGSKVAGVRVILATARAAVVEDLLRKAWLRKAPRSLAKGLRRPP
jgi:hypothetical protein